MEQMNSVLDSESQMHSGKIMVREKKELIFRACIHLDLLLENIFGGQC